MDIGRRIRFGVIDLDFWFVSFRHGARGWGCAGSADDGLVSPPPTGKQVAALPVLPAIPPESCCAGFLVPADEPRAQAVVRRSKMMMTFPRA